MTEWKKVLIKDLGRTVTGHTPPTKEKKYYGNFMPFVKPTDISKESKYTYHPEQYYSREASEKYKSSLIPKGATCVVCIGTIGEKITMAHCDLFTNQSINSIIPSDDYDPEFVYYLLKYNLGKVKSLNKGTASGREFVSKSTFLDMPVMVCKDKDTQIRIGKILSRYDALIENYQQKIKLLEEAAQRLYKEWFVDLHFPEYENTKIVDGVPEGWEKAPISSIIKIKSGFAFKSKDFRKEGLYKIVTIKNVKDGNFDGVNVDKISILPNKIPEHCKLKEGDILLSLTGIVGRVCFVIGKNYLLNQRVAKLSTEYSSFAYCLFRSREMSIILSNLSNGVAQQNLSPIKTEQLKILIPDRQTLNSFESMAGKMLTKVINLSTQIRFLTEARDRLLPKLMSGEIEV